MPRPERAPRRPRTTPSGAEEAAPRQEKDVDADEGGHTAKRQRPGVGREEQTAPHPAPSEDGDH